ncbi:RHS repeat domain-containing protein, partial [Oceanospirillum beijerinckii]|uniref:RHS repeat domain-containing protein n=1 Tax=Oceanospirillum beijerinckii TaxID=64976 RepID=UPI0005693103
MQVQTNQQLPVSFRYDAQGRISQRITHLEDSEKPNIRTWYYDDNGEQPVRIQWEDGTSSQFEYDVEGNLVSTVNPAGHSERYQYGAFDKLIQSTDPLGASTFYFYNKEGEFSGVANS